MSISDRLKEERLRLGLSQTAFAALAGATKSAQVKWERGETTPTAAALSELAEAGADVLYIVTGRRTSDAAASDPAALSTTAMLAVRLDDLEAEASLVPRGGNDEVRVRADLNQFANYPAGTVDQAILVRADRILRREFGDEVAAERSRARVAAAITTKERYAHDLLHLVADMSLDIDPKVERELTVLMYERGIEADEIIPLLDAMRKADAVVWPIGGEQPR